jgi:site-specific recombinase XerD
MPYKGQADSTWKTYKTAVESFQSFRKLYNLQDTWPAPPYDLLFYIAYMSHTGLSASTITTYISGISTMHKSNGHKVLGVEPNRVLNILEGI